MKKIAIIILFLSCTSLKQVKDRSVIDYVPDKKTAIKIAEAIWLPIYGEDIYEKKPFVAKLIDDKIWSVKGTLNPDYVGGVPMIEIQKKDAKVIKVIHTK